ncbi:SH3 domain-containing protein [Sphingomonas tabacisoli]|uniref:SH3 domain-containing protein n=1 Tax=Sphingomonas tabacisoli TaxID=2249466 RepID=A0ABW4HZH9_9SPHN
MRTALLAALALLIATEAPAQDKKPPYWASIVPSQARIRTGPGRNFPAVWQYQRAGLPVKVIAIFPSWRKIEDPDGAQGWMQANMLTDERTGMVTGGVQPMRAKPDANAPIVWRAEAGVVGKLRSCSSGWCDFDVKGRRGWIEASHLWGVGSDEAVAR